MGRWTDRLRPDVFEGQRRSAAPSRSRLAGVSASAPWATSVPAAPTAPSSSSVIGPPTGHANGRVVALRTVDGGEPEMVTPASDDGAWVGDDGQTYREVKLHSFTDTLANRTRLITALAAKRPGDWQLVALAEDGEAVVVDGQPPRRWSAITHRLAADVRPSQAPEIAGHLARVGEVLVAFEPHGKRVAVGQAFAPVETDFRARLCAVIKCEKWELGDTTVRFDPAGGERRLRLRRTGGGSRSAGQRAAPVSRAGVPRRSAAADRRPRREGVPSAEGVVGRAADAGVQGDVLAEVLHAGAAVGKLDDGPHLGILPSRRGPFRARRCCTVRSA